MVLFLAFITCPRLICDGVIALSVIALAVFEAQSAGIDELYDLEAIKV